MGRGGAETWLMHVLRHIDRNKFQMDFLVQTTHPAPFDDEIKKLGSKVIICLGFPNPWKTAKNFNHILSKYGPYDVVHSHIHNFSGFILKLAYRAGVPIRIAHSHNDLSTLKVNAGLYRRMYLRLTELWINKYSTSGLACSKQAASDLFGPYWETDSRWKVTTYSIDLSHFKDDINPSTVRLELGIPDDAFVVGHVGSFRHQKNHKFLVDIFSKILNFEPKGYLLLVGDGSLKPIIEQQVSIKGLSDRVIFTGLKADVPRLMCGAMDVFLFPSLFEGLPLVLLEAQASGLPCVISNVISEEVDVVKNLIRRVSLSQSASVWAEEVFAMRDDMHTVTKLEALTIFEQNSFNIMNNVRELERLYTL